MSESDWTAGALIAEAWERHTKVLTPAEPAWCELCDEVWPCLTIRLASELNSIPSQYPDMWLPYPPAELARRGRCVQCGCHPKQGHKDECPREETDAN